MLISTYNCSIALIRLMCCGGKPCYWKFTNCGGHWEESRGISKESFIKKKLNKMCIYTFSHNPRKSNIKHTFSFLVLKVFSILWASLWGTKRVFSSSWKIDYLSWWKNHSDHIVKEAHHRNTSLQVKVLHLNA